MLLSHTSVTMTNLVVLGQMVYSNMVRNESTQKLSHTNGTVAVQSGTSCYVTYNNRGPGRETPIFIPCFYVGILYRCLGLTKLEWCPYKVGEKFGDMYTHTRFDTMPKSDGQTDNTAWDSLEYLKDHSSTGISEWVRVWVNSLIHITSHSIRIRSFRSRVSLFLVRQSDSCLDSTRTEVIDHNSDNWQSDGRTSNCRYIHSAQRNDNKPILRL